MLAGFLFRFFKNGAAMKTDLFTPTAANPLKARIPWLANSHKVESSNTKNRKKLTLEQKQKDDLYNYLQDIVPYYLPSRYKRNYLYTGFVLNCGLKA